MENQLIRGQVFDVLFNYAEKWGSICTESDCATVRDEICLRIDQSQFTADEAEDYINQEVEKRIAERMPSDELTDLAEIEKIILSNYHHFKDSATVSWSMTAANIIIKLFRSRLTCSEKPNNSQKTEGGEG